MMNNIEFKPRLVFNNAIYIGGEILVPSNKDRTTYNTTYASVIVPIGKDLQYILDTKGLDKPDLIKEQAYYMAERVRETFNPIMFTYLSNEHDKYNGCLEYGEMRKINQVKDVVNELLRSKRFDEFIEKFVNKEDFPYLYELLNKPFDEQEIDLW